MFELLWRVIAHLLSILNKGYNWTALDSRRSFVVCLEQGIWEKFFEQSSSILNKKYDWNSLNSHRPFVIHLEQGTWVNCFEQSTSICYASWTRNMSEILWTVIAHLLSILNKGCNWTALDSHRPFVVCLEQGIWEKFFEQSSSILNKKYDWNSLNSHRPFVIHLEQGTWEKFFEQSSSVLNKKYDWNSLNNHRPFVIHLEQGTWVNCFEQSTSICYASWTRNMSELLWTINVHLLCILNKEYEWTSLDSHRPFVVCLEQGIWEKFFEQSSPIYYPSWTKNMSELLWSISVH